MPIDLGQFKKKETITRIQDENKITHRIKKISEVKEKTKINDLDFKTLTMDQVRGLYIWICKKSPKHDSKHTKNFLIDNINEVLDKSKIK